MGVVRRPRPVKLIAGLLAPSAELLDEARQALERHYGAIDTASGPAQWNVSNYYEDEMGPDIRRQFVGFEALIDPDRIAAIKLHTNTLEDTWRQAGKRKVNIDPGYVGLAKLVLATTKDAAQRIYLADGIYAEPTLRYDHTYADYAGALEFFNAVRARYLEQLRTTAPS